jgi:hypothetical protein
LSGLAYAQAAGGFHDRQQVNRRILQGFKLNFLDAQQWRVAGFGVTLVPQPR